MNEIIADRPKDLTVRMHMCRGNLSASGFGRRLRFLADTIFNTIGVDAFLMEYDTERAGLHGSVSCRRARWRCWG
jgi:5-methyltetrahydropteroyltriglutamate--homocysteine methyltransferase